MLEISLFIGLFVSKSWELRLTMPINVGDGLLVLLVVIPQGFFHERTQSSRKIKHLHSVNQSAQPEAPPPPHS